MKNYLQLLAVMVATLFATSAMAFTPPPSPKPASNILDQAHVLTPGELTRLNDQLRQVNSTSANEIGVLIVPSLDGQDIRDVGYTTGRAWGVGKSGLDNGVMIVWSPTDRKIGIETGKGVEGDLPDLKCNDIIRNVIGPNFKDKRYEQGLSNGFTAIASAIADHRKELVERDRQAADSQHSNTHSSGGCEMATQQAGLGSGLFWILVLGGGFWYLRSRRRAAHRRQEQETEEQHARYQDDIDRNKVVEESLRRTVAPTPVPVSTVVPRHVSPPVPVHRIETPSVPSVVVPVAVAAVSTAVADMALAEERERQAHLRQLEREREETRQARLQQLDEERHQREREEESNSLAAAAAIAAAAVISSSSSDDDSSSSSSGGGIDFGSDSGGSGGGGDFGGGDFGGGGSSSDY